MTKCSKYWDSHIWIKRCLMCLLEFVRHAHFDSTVEPDVEHADARVPNFISMGKRTALH